MNFFIYKKIIICYKINMKKRTKIIITSISLAALLGVACTLNHEYHPNYTIVGEVNTTMPYATYSDGNVYIIKYENMDIIDSLILNEKDVVVIDSRDDDNPDMQVLSSYAITDKEKRNEIIEIMQDYNSKYPSKWKRTNKSLRLEWYVHNLLYNYNYKLDHTTDVDFDNNDEEVYDKPFFNSILHI